MSRKTLFTLFFFLAAACAFAKGGTDARAILDKTAKTIRSAGDMEIQFKASSFMSEKQKGGMKGTLYMKGKKFHLVSPNMICWYDGSSLWSMNNETKEVNLSTPSNSEKQSMNPYLFVDMYKKGYTYSLGETTLRGKQCYEVTLTADSKKRDVQEMILTIDKSSHMPLCVRMRQGNNYWVRLSVLNYKTQQKYAADKFQFNNKDYPTATIIDIR